MVFKKSKLINLFTLILFFIFLLSSPVIADKLTVETQNGYGILTPKQEAIKEGENYTLHIDVYDISDGTYVTNETAICYLDVFSQDGITSFFSRFNFTGEELEGDWNIKIPGETFDELGTYTYMIECDGKNGNLGGARSESILVTPTGNKDISLGQGIVLIGSLFVILFIAWLFFSFSKDMDSTPSKVISIGVSGVMIMVAVLFTTAAMQKFVWLSGSLLESYGTLWLITKVVISMGVLAVVLYAGYLALSLWRYKRGLTD